jgi:hypothetical protein
MSTIAPSYPSLDAFYAAGHFVDGGGRVDLLARRSAAAA